MTKLEEIAAAIVAEIKAANPGCKIELVGTETARAAVEAMRKVPFYKSAMPYLDSYSSNGAWWEAQIDAILSEKSS